MSSPSQRRSQRNSQAATPGRTTRSSQAARSSPANNNADDAAAPQAAAGNTPRNTRSSQLASSPLFYQSSPGNGNNRDVSTPLRQNTESQSTNGNRNAAPSSPLRGMSNSQDAMQTDGDRTPRASGSGLLGGASISQIPLPVLGNKAKQCTRILSNSIRTQLQPWP